MYEIIHDHLLSTLWLGWGLVWFLSAWSVKAAARKESVPSRLAHMVPLIVAGWLLGGGHAQAGFLGRAVWRSSEATFWTGTGIVVLGLTFSLWARFTLGRNWSGTVTVKEDHELVRGGPYRFVRHPIYTGLLLGFIGTAVVVGQWRGVLAVLLVLVSLWRKLRLEERWMGEVFGGHYEAYRREVRALVPFLL